MDDAPVLRLIRLAPATICAATVGDCLPALRTCPTAGRPLGDPRLRCRHHREAISSPLAVVTVMPAVAQARQIVMVPVTLKRGTPSGQGQVSHRAVRRSLEIVVDVVHHDPVAYPHHKRTPVRSSRRAGMAVSCSQPGSGVISPSSKQFLT